MSQEEMIQFFYRKPVEELNPLHFCEPVNLLSDSHEHRERDPFFVKVAGAQ